MDGVLRRFGLALSLAVLLLSAGIPMVVIAHTASAEGGAAPVLQQDCVRPTIIEQQRCLRDLLDEQKRRFRLEDAAAGVDWLGLVGVGLSLIGVAIAAMTLRHNHWTLEYTRQRDRRSALEHRRDREREAAYSRPRMAVDFVRVLEDGGELFASYRFRNVGPSLARNTKLSYHALLHARGSQGAPVTYTRFSSRYDDSEPTIVRDATPSPTRLLGRMTRDSFGNETDAAIFLGMAISYRDLLGVEHVDLFFFEGTIAANENATTREVTLVPVDDGRQRLVEVVRSGPLVDPAGASVALRAIGHRQNLLPAA